MTKPMKKLSVKGHNVDKELAEVEKLFRKLDHDKSLPTFGQHFMYCLAFGISERVNLKKLYPKTHKKLSEWLTKHDKRILAAK
jgi:hypothetical protein